MTSTLFLCSSASGCWRWVGPGDDCFDSTHHLMVFSLRNILRGNLDYVRARSEERAQCARGAGPHHPERREGLVAMATAEYSSRLHGETVASARRKFGSLPQVTVWNRSLRFGTDISDVVMETWK